MNNHRFFRPFSQSNQPSLSAATKNFVSSDVKINHDKVLSEAPKQFSQNFVHFATFRNPTLMQSHTIAIKNLSCFSCLPMLKKIPLSNPNRQRVLSSLSLSFSNVFVLLHSKKQLIAIQPISPQPHTFSGIKRILFHISQPQALQSLSTL